MQNGKRGYGATMRRTCEWLGVLTPGGHVPTAFREAVRNGEIDATVMRTIEREKDGQVKRLMTSGPVPTVPGYKEVGVRYFVSGASAAWWVERNRDRLPG